MTNYYGCLAQPVNRKMLEKMRQRLPPQGQPHYWCGIKYDASVNKFIWSDGTVITETREFLEIVDKSEQENRNFKKRCLMVSRDDDELKAMECNSSKKYLCQVKDSGGSSVSTPTSTTATSAKTPSSGSTASTATSASTASTAIAPSSGSTASTAATSTDASTARTSQSSTPSTLASQSTQTTAASGSPATTASKGKPDKSTKHPPKTSKPGKPTKAPSTPTSRSTQTTPSTEKPNGSEKVKSYNKKIKSKNAKDPNSLDDAMNITSDLMSTLKSSENNGNGKDNNVMGASQELEKFLLKYAKEQLKKNSSTTKIIKTSQGLSVTIQLISANTTKNLEFPAPTESGEVDGKKKRHSFVTLPSGIFNNQERVVVSAVMNGVKEMLSTGAQAIVDGTEVASTELNSGVVTCTLDPAPDGVLAENITITLQHDKTSSPDDRPMCVFWDVHAQTEFNGSWSRRGCTVVASNASLTICSCNHMTSFALLMQVDPGKPVGKKHKLALQIITFVGCSLSLVGEVLTVIAYVALTNIKQQEQSQIRINLVVSLAIAQIFFLSGISATENQGVCIFVAVMIHYMYLVAFGWMMLEGVYLYLMVVKVFNTEVKLKLYYAFSWGFPLLVVLTSIVIASTLEDGISSYTNNEFCWVSFSNGLVWTFVAPVLLISLVNLMVLIRVVRELTRLQSAKMSDTNNAKQGVKACVVLFPLLGLTWVFGILAVTEAGLVFQYIFTILNSLQGFLIFVLHVLRSSEIRHAFQRKRRQWETTRATDLSSSTKSHVDASVVSYNRQPLTDLDSTDSSQGRRNQVAPSPQPVRTDSARTCITPVENARDNWGANS